MYQKVKTWIVRLYQKVKTKLNQSEGKNAKVVLEGKNAKVVLEGKNKIVNESKIGLILPEDERWCWVETHASSVGWYKFFLCVII